MLPLIIDIVILVCLGVTIFYAMRLTAALNNFKAHRKEFEGLMGDLSQNIAQAQNAMMALKTASKKTGSDLQEKISDAVALCDELQLMTEVGNKLAGRLEDGATASKKPAALNEKKELPSFFIKDPEFGEDDALESDPQEAEGSRGDTNVKPFALHDRDEDTKPKALGDGAHLQSEAEKELFKALQRNKNS